MHPPANRPKGFDHRKRGTMVVERKRVHSRGDRGAPPEKNMETRHSMPPSSQPSNRRALDESGDMPDTIVIRGEGRAGKAELIPARLPIGQHIHLVNSLPAQHHD